MKTNNRKLHTSKEIAESIGINEADETLGLDMDDMLSKSKDGIIKKVGEKTWGVVKAIGKALGKAVQSYAADKAGDLIDELLLGQFKDSMVDIYKSEKLDKMSDDDAQKVYADLAKDDPKFKRGEERSNLSSRKDENASTEVDESTATFSALWYSNKKDENLGKQLSELVTEIQQNAKDTEKQQKELASKLKSMKVKVTDEDFANYGPMLAKAVADGNSAEEISNNLKKLKGEVKESYTAKINRIKKQAMLVESRFLLTEDIKQKALLESIVMTDAFQAVVADYMMKNHLITEGFWSKALKAAGGAAAGAVIYKMMPSKWKDKVKDFSQKAVKILTDKTLSGIVSLGGLAVSTITGGWGATLALKAIYAVERHGKVLANAFERQFTRFANSKGVITSMDFKIKDQKDSGYSMRFYAKDMVWRVLNIKDQLKHPGKDYAKAIVDGVMGKKYRAQLAKIWDPLFADAKGGKIDFEELFKQAKNVKISEKALKAYSDFANQYDKIKANCIDSPKIDTRTQSIKKDRLDK